MKNVSFRLQSLRFPLIAFYFLLAVLAAALPSQATVIGWGTVSTTNDYGQLNIPAGLTSAQFVASGGWHGLAVTSSNTVVAWGLNDYGQTNVPAGLTNAVAVAGGFDHSLALTADGSVIGWGITSNLFEGDPDWFGQADVPSDLTPATAISAGAFHSMALKADGTVEAWGYDFYGQCDVPPGLNHVVAIACGGYFSLALTTNGTVTAWGDNYYGQTNLPADLTNVMAIAAGGVHGLALKADGTVEGWGARGVTDLTQDFGQETPPPDLGFVTGIAAGFFHSLAVQSDGTVRQWGDTSQGQSRPPTNLVQVLSLAGGFAHSFALKNDLPVIITQPTNVVTLTNKTVNFDVKVSGLAPIRGTWWRTGSPTNILLGSVVASNVTAISVASFPGGTVRFPGSTNGIADFTLTLQPTYPALTNTGSYSFFAVCTNSLGVVTSTVASLTVMTPPKITNQPAGVAASSGSTVYFSVGASGSQPFSYEWLLNGTPLELDNPTNVLELDNISTNDAGNYQVIVANAVGFVMSSNATLAVDGAPAITIQPTNTVVTLGSSNVIFWAGVDGAYPLNYVWYYFQGTNISSAVPVGYDVFFPIYYPQTTNAGNYFMVVSNGYGSVTSSVVSLTVLTPPIIVAVPTNVITMTNRAVSFAAQVSGATPMRGFWWRIGGTSNVLVASIGFTNSIATASFVGGTLQATSVTNLGLEQFSLNLQATYPTLTNAGNYSFYFVCTNSLGYTTSSVVALAVMTPPRITNQPVSVATSPGATVFFSANASGSQPLSYQWFLNGSPLPYNLTGTNSVLELDNVSTNDAGNYQLWVSNAVGSVMSSVAMLTVDGTPTITLQPTNTGVIIGSNATLYAAAAGADPLTYQWYYSPTNSDPTNFVPLADGLNANYTIAFAVTNITGAYFLVVSNTFGAATSSVAVLTVLTPPVFVFQPLNVVTQTSKAVSFVARVSGATPMRATWWRIGNATNLASVGFTNTTVTASFIGGNAQATSVTNQQGLAQFTLNLLTSYPAVTNVGSYSFFVVCSNSLGVVTGNVATLTVMTPPKITSPPVNVATNPGATVFFNVAASGTQPLSYQWYLNGSPLVNGTSTNSMLELDNVSTNDAGGYQIVVSNAVGSASATAYLNVLVNGSQSAPYLWLLNHDSLLGDGILIALESGRNYRVQASVDLQNWTDVTNFLSHSSFVIFTNSTFTNLPSQYYRVVTP